MTMNKLIKDQTTCLVPAKDFSANHLFAMHKANSLLLFLFCLTSFFMHGQIQTLPYASNNNQTAYTAAGINYGPLFITATANQYSRNAYVYPQSLIGTANANCAGVLTNGDVISVIGFQRGFNNGVTLNNTTNLKIYLVNLTAATTNWGATTLSWSTQIAASSLVYDGNPASVINAGATKPGNVYFPITNFTYTGGSLGVLVEYSQTTAQTNEIAWGYENSTTITQYVNNSALGVSGTGAFSNTLGAVNSQSNRHPTLFLSKNVYCLPYYTTGCSNTVDIITKVEIGTLSHTGTSGTTCPTRYRDYTTSVTAPNLEIGTVYPLKITTGADASNFTAAWFDFNNDGDFLDAGEYFNGGNTGSGGTATINVTIPSGTSGNIRMRVRGGEDATINLQSYACGASPSGYGEARDYLLAICTTPTLYTVSGTGSYCAGGSGLAVGLSGSQTGVNYQLKRGGTDVGSAVAGTGSALNFGNQTTAGVYTVVATGTGSYCNTGTNMTGSATITVNSLSTAASGISGPGSVVSGMMANLSVSGGSLGTGASWKWYTGSCGGTLVNTGATYSPTVSSATTYYVRAEGTCNNTACVSINIAVESSCDVIYVDGTNGDDAYSGTAMGPVKTLYRASQLASGSRNYIKMTSGTYTEANVINLQSNMVIEGRYSVSSGVWTKSSNTALATSITMSGTETINNDVAHTIGFKSNGAGNWKLIDLNVVTAAASGQTTSGNGKSNYAVYISGTASSGYEIIRCNITGGNASNGSGAGTTGYNGSNGTAGTIGVTGPGGNSACGYDGPTAGGNGGAGGTGGANATRIGGSAVSGSAGGKGGTGIDDDGYYGTAGSGRTGTCSGGGGVLGGNDSGNDDTPYGGDGSDCTTAGAAGTNGTTGTASFLSGYFVPGTGTNGTAGSGGGGGAGGGGGGEDTGGCEAGGSGGSGGSGGGGGGGAGAGGSGGGASFGVFVWNGGTGGVITESIIAAQTPGTGGTGGVGGNGGAGAAKSAQGNTSSDGQSNRGGKGGAGSAGGKGGNGGNGAAGVQYAIANQGGGTLPTITSLSPAIAANSSTSGGSIINSTVVSLNAVPNKLCQNSVLSMTTSNPSWALPAGWDYVKYNNTGVASEFSSSNTTVDVMTTNTSGSSNLTANGAVFNSYLTVSSARTAPAITILASDGSTLNPAATICAGSAAKLSAASWGTEVEYKWEIFSTINAPNKGSVTGLVYSYNTQSPVTGTLSLGTYLVRYQVKEECCGWSIPVFAVITVIASPTASIISADAAICAGSAFSLTGNVSSGAAWTITLSNGDVISGPSTQTTWTKSVSPSTTTTYTISSVTSGSCTGSVSGSTTLTLPTTPTALSGSGTSVKVCAASGSSFIQFVDDVSGKLIAAVNPNGNDLGNVTVTSYVGSPSTVYACNTSSNPLYQTSYMGRTWVVKSSAYPSGNFPGGAVTLRLPFNNGELTDMNTTASTVSTGNPNDNGAVLGTLMLTKHSRTTPATEDSDPTNNCTGGTTLGITTQAGSGTNILGIASTSYVDFQVSGFSEMYLHKNFGGSPLPVTLTDFKGTCTASGEIQLSWSTSSEQNSEAFIVQRSRDMQDWVFAATLPAAGNSNHLIAYSFEDESALEGKSYYRLVQKDFNGEERVFGPISVSCGIDHENSLIVFPNPTNGDFTVQISSVENSGAASIQLMDLTGKMISERKLNIIEGKNQVLFEGLNLPMGTYIVKLVSGTEVKPVKLVVNQ